MQRCGRRNKAANVQIASAAFLTNIQPRKPGILYKFV